MKAFRGAFRDPRPADNTQELLSGLIAEIFAREDRIYISLVDIKSVMITAPASLYIDNDADADADAP